MLIVPKILGHGQGRGADPKPAARRLVHLAIDHHHVVQDAGVFHAAIELFAFAATLADSAEDAHALLMADHVVDHLGEKHRLAHTRATEQSSLASALQWHKHVDRLDTRLEDLGLCRTLRQRRRSPMDGPPLDILRRRLAVDGGAEHVEHPRHDFLAYRHFERLT
jgi:hypothetical protein